KSRLLGEFFTENTFYDLTGNGQRLYEISSRQELVQLIARVRAKLARLELALDDIGVSIEKETASVRLRGTGLGTIRGEEGQFLEVHSVEIQLEKPEDTWLVTGARHLRNERAQAN
ncbi:MAG TPA: nuclear transport factor 2 family protein, partial [Gammaproteobacteria bacterium]|nr:nuclear transport factor 2 family protein [Gammaproteobacteria bacterium]